MDLHRRRRDQGDAGAGAAGVRRGAKRQRDQSSAKHSQWGLDRETGLAIPFVH
jgi:hypothetical protein